MPRDPSAQLTAQRIASKIVLDKLKNRHKLSNKQLAEFSDEAPAKPRR
jgi:hypothetical protein